MKKLSKMRMVRPSDAFLPAAFGITGVLGGSFETEKVFLVLLFTRLFALASARGLRLAFSEQPSMRRARGSVKAALLLQLMGAVVMLLANLVRDCLIVPTNLIYIGIALLLNIEHVFYEYLYAAGDGHSATLARAITAVLLAGGILLGSPDSHVGLLPYRLEWALGAAALSALVAAVIGLALGGGLKGKLNGQVLKCAPLAMLQTLIYPALWLGMTMIPGSPLKEARTFAPFFLGLMVYELCRAPFRRSPTEARPMNRALLITAAAALLIAGACLLPATQTPLRNLLGIWFPDLLAASLSTLAACASAFAMYGNVYGAEGE